MDRRADTGRRGELAAETRYVARGYRVVARNWRCRLGELDLVLARGSALVICEVKTRRGSRYGGGYEAVDSMFYYAQAGPFADDVEERIFTAIRQAMKAVGR